MTAPRIVFVVFPGFEMLDLAGPHEVFAQANRQLGEGGCYSVAVVAAASGTAPASSGLLIVPTGRLADVRGPLDTLVAVGGGGVEQACADPDLVARFGRLAGRARRVASVCSGAFLLAEAGLLDGRRAVTHWARCEELARKHPSVTVDPDPIFIRDGDVWTSAGITAGIDLALAMVEEDHGAEISRTIARRLVMFVQRPGGQAQFSTQLTARRPTGGPLREVVGWIADHLGADLGVPALAGRAGMSERNFSRVFRAETGRTPAAYVEASRIEAARRLLESTDATVETVAGDCGFGAVETMHRSFKRLLRVTPGDYRRRFSAGPARTPTASPPLAGAPPGAARPHAAGPAAR